MAPRSAVASRIARRPPVLASRSPIWRGAARTQANVTNAKATVNAISTVASGAPTLMAMLPPALSASDTRKATSTPPSPVRADVGGRATARDGPSVGAAVRYVPHEGQHPRELVHAAPQPPQ